jgi:hypothetical protein
MKNLFLATVSFLLIISCILLVLSSIRSFANDREWIERDNKIQAQREKEDTEVATFLSREELLSLCNKIADQGDMFLANRLRVKGGLPQDTRWKQ